MPEDLWATESGLLDDVDVTIEKAYFATDARYNNGYTLLMHWEGSTSSEDNPTFHEMIPCGDGWQSLDGGKTATHPKGKKRFVSSSVYGRIIDRCINEFKIGDLLRKRGAPTEAKVWVGLRFHMKREKLEFGSGLEARERLMPVKFLGVATENAAQAKQPATASTAQETDEQMQARVHQLALYAQVKALAKQEKSFEKFVEKAMEIEGVADDAELVGRIVDQEHGVWAEAHNK